MGPGFYFSGDHSKKEDAISHPSSCNGYNSTWGMWTKVVLIFLKNKAIEIAKGLGIIIGIILCMAVGCFLIMALAYGLGYIIIKLFLLEGDFELCMVYGFGGLFVLTGLWGVLYSLLKKLPAWIKSNWIKAKKEAGVEL